MRAGPGRGRGRGLCRHGAGRRDRDWRPAHIHDRPHLPRRHVPADLWHHTRIPRQPAPRRHVRAPTVTVDRLVAWFGGPVIQSVHRRFIAFAAGALLLISTSPTTSLAQT